jgi:hypothetical protein
VTLPKEAEILFGIEINAVMREEETPKFYKKENQNIEEGVNLDLSYIKKLTSR